uniref:glycosyltransferase family 4 protein n=1 Tax=Fluviicola sp. TaxID=1917219 RepID=UPI00404B628D
MKRKLVYYHNGTSTFIEKDIEILKTEYDVQVEYFDTVNKYKLPVELIKQFFKLTLLKKDTIVVSQFAGFHTALPSFFDFLNKLKTVIVLGGTDCVHLHSIRYGNYDRFFLRIFTKYSIKNASLLLPVDDSLIRYKYNYQSNDKSEQGFEIFCGKIKGNVEVIYNGYDASKWRNSTRKREENSFVTIGGRLNSRFGFQLKGIDLIIDVARLNPSSKFYIIGGKSLDLYNKPNNVILIDKIPNNELNEFLQSMEFYLQLSMSEGFPNALCEAMLSGCIPIISNVGAMPKIVKETGYTLDKKDVYLLDKIIKDSIALDSEIKKDLSVKSHNRIKNNFTFLSRKEKILNAIKKACN